MVDRVAPLAALAAGVARDGAAVLVTVAATRGSAPRDAGTVMGVGRDRVDGTIGGGHLEFEAIRMARAALAAGDPTAPWLVRFPLAARVGQCCGGVVTLAFEPVRAADRWLADAVAVEATGTRFALVSCVGRSGRLLVTAEHIGGSLGDPRIDAPAIATARRALATGDGAQVIEVGAPSANERRAARDAATVPPGHAVAQAAAPATLLVRVASARDFTILVFGNGHVGRALVPMLAAVPAQVRWIDARETDFPASVPAGVDVIATDIPEAELAQAPPGACVVVATHDHALDFALVAAALMRDDWTYLGLIGSRSKHAQFEGRLAARGVPPAALARIVCPIGATAAPALAGKAPGVIALAAAVEIVTAHERARTHGGREVEQRHTATAPAPPRARHAVPEARTR